MNTTYKQQIEAIQKAQKVFYDSDESDIDTYLALNDAVKTIELTPVLQGHIDKVLEKAANVSQIEIDEYKAKIAELEKQLAHYADVNQNQ